jgi:hypothetical protein
MDESLARMVQPVRKSADGNAHASAEIASGKQDLSTRTEQTSGDLQATASAMEQLTSTVRRSTRKARQTSQLASSASFEAQRGDTVVQEVVRTVDEVKASGKKIADIIGVIDGVAFQTNILALNAAVEAARAGEQRRSACIAGLGKPPPAPSAPCRPPRRQRAGPATISSGKASESDTGQISPEGKRASVHFGNQFNLHASTHRDLRHAKGAARMRPAFPEDFAQKLARTVGHEVLLREIRGGIDERHDLDDPPYAIEIAHSRLQRAHQVDGDGPRSGLALVRPHGLAQLADPGLALPLGDVAAQEDQLADLYIGYIGCGRYGHGGQVDAKLLHSFMDVHGVSLVKV